MPRLRDARHVLCYCRLKPEGGARTMRTFACVCGNRLFFENTLCLACQREVGWCPECRNISALIPEEGGRFQCGNEHCQAALVKCRNYVVENVCNRCLSASPGNGAEPPPL